MRLLKNDYYQRPLPPGLWSHKWRLVLFSLIVDDFGVKYVGKSHANNLLNALNENFEVTVNEKATSMLE